MARTLNATAHALKRDAFLDAAERLIRTVGYEQMTIQGLLNDLDASRGAFYHYFDSKEALLEAVIQRIADAGVGVIEPIAADPSLPAAAKLQAVFSTAGRWKTERSDLLLPLLRSWYSPENDLVRLRIAQAGASRLTPILARIVRQGAAEGTFSAAWPDHAASILMVLLGGSGDTAGRMLLGRHDGLVTFEEVERFVSAHNEAIERILGLPAGSFVLVDSQTLRAWFG